MTIDIHNKPTVLNNCTGTANFFPPRWMAPRKKARPFIPPHGSRRISFVPRPSGFRFYHTHVHAKADLTAGQYSGLVGPVYIEAKEQSGRL